MTETHDTDRPTGAIDVHQHLWPDELVDRLRARSKAPYLRGWTLHDVVPCRVHHVRRFAVGVRPGSRRTETRGWPRPASASLRLSG